MSEEDRSTKPTGSITIDQLLALNEEIAALVRAGVPLERGLLETGSEVRGRLGRIAAALGRRLGRGESLVDALEAERQSIPPLYRAVVEAGTRAGRLPVALEGVARYVKGYSEARGAIGLALWYPMMVVGLGYLLFVGFTAKIAPIFLGTFDKLGLATIAPLRWLDWLGSWAYLWWPIGPIILAFLAIAWIRSGRISGMQTRLWGLLRVFPWMGSLLADYEAANFSELLALLLEHQVPYPSALVLAAESTGNPRMIRGARALAEAVTRGEPVATALQAADRAAFLPMLRWTLSAGEAQGSLSGALHNLAIHYGKRGRFQAEKLYVFLPIILLVVIGATTTLFYGLTLFVPLTTLLQDLSV